MANGYQEYSLGQGIMQGGTGLKPSDILDMWRKGADYASQQRVDAQKSKLRDIAIRQGTANAQSTELANQTNQLKLEQLQKEMPLFDAETNLKLKQTADALKLEPQQFKLDTMRIMSSLKNYPMEQWAQHLQGLNQVLTAAGSDPQRYAQITQNPQFHPLMKEFGLTGDFNKDKPAIKSIQAATMQIPKLQEQLIARETAARYSYMGRVYAADAKNKGLSQFGKIKSSISPNDIKAAYPVLEGSGIAEGMTADQKDYLATNLATYIKTFTIQTGDPAYAQQLAVEQLQSDVAAVNSGEASILDELRSKLGIAGGKQVPQSTHGTKLTPSPEKPPAGTQHFNVGGVDYYIPDKKVADFKKKAGIK
jgi:hypothetical protein